MDEILLDWLLFCIVFEVVVILGELSTCKAD